MTEIQQTKRKHALLIGINEYPNWPSYRQLQGCVNDIELVSDLLCRQFGFSDSNIKLLKDGQATRDGILGAMERLVQRVKPNDLVVFHYSGHGSQMTDREGDEPDGLDETIVPHDSGREPHPNRDITDDEIYNWLLRLTEKTPYVTLIFDSCHSGSVARDFFGARERWVEPDERLVADLPPSPASKTTARGLRRDTGPSGWLPLGKRYVLIAGCRDEESSYEYRDPEGDSPFGAMTYFLCQEITQTEAGTTYLDIFERVSAQVTAIYPRQQPQMEGARHRELFGVRSIEPMRFVPVTRRSGDEVRLAAGAAHGMTVGSKYAVYPQGTHHVDSEITLGLVKITSVHALTSDASILTEDKTGTIAEGDRAVEEAHNYGEMRMRVQVDAPSGYGKNVQALMHEIEDSPLLRQAKASEQAEAMIYLIPTRTSLSEGDPVPQLKTVEHPTWAVVGRDGKLLMPIHPANKSGVAALLRDNLEKWVRYRQALRLTNPDRDSRLRNRIDFMLLRMRADGTWIDAEPEEAGGEVVFEEGERIAFRVTNNTDGPVYVSILDFGLTGRISLLHPVEGASESLAEGKTIEVGVRRGDEINLFLPEDFPYVTDPEDKRPAQGLESFKLFVTSHPAKFDILLQDGVRGEGEQSLEQPLEQLLNLALTGKGTRDARRNRRPPDEEWTTVTHPFILRQETSDERLSPDGQPVGVGSVRLRTPGLSGHAKSLPPFSARTRSIDLLTDTLEEVLERENVEERETIEILDAKAADGKRTVDVPVIELEVPAQDDQAGQFLLYTDESGVTTWHFPKSAAPSVRGGEAGGKTYQYVIDRRVVVPEEQRPGMTSEGTRSLTGAFGNKLLKVLVFPLVDPIIGEVGDFFAGRWEKKKRPYRIRSFTPDNYRDADAPGIGGVEWQHLSSGKALLFVHGTFSRAHSGFGALPANYLAELHRIYDGRVFAFDHYTLSHDPKENIEWFVQQLPQDVPLELDIVCHSRGGLVSRVLAEKQSEFSLGSRNIQVKKVIFAGTPNAGTTLTDPEYMGDFVDTYTNLLHFIPDNPITDILDGVITVAKQLAVGTLKGLDGLQAMRPESTFQQWLNSGPSTKGIQYFALASNYEPSTVGYKEFVKDRLMDTIFNNDNDLVVPTAGVYDTNGSGLFPIDKRYAFSPTEGVAHTTFFASRKAREQMMEWLTT